MPRVGQVKPVDDERLTDRIAVGVLTSMFPPALVDEVLEVMLIGAEQIEPPPELCSHNGEMDFILGIGKAEKRVICLLDIEQVLSQAETIHLREFEAVGA